MLTTAHPRFAEFIDRLSGPEGCDFIEVRGEHGGMSLGETRWKCDGSRDRLKATRILREMGFDETFIYATLAYFAEHGGYCDCEILMNVDRICEPLPAAAGPVESYPF